MNALDLLPIEMWREIALQHPTSWYVLIRVVGGLYRAEDRKTLKERGVEMEKYDYGGYCWTLYGKIHRDKGEGPAYRRSDKYREEESYYSRGERHRDSKEGPAMTQVWLDEYVTTKTYYEMGEIHRDPSDGPAYWCDDGDWCMYYVRGLQHRDPREGPAAVYGDNCPGDQIVEYWWNGKLYRDPKEGPHSLLGRFDLSIGEGQHIPHVDVSRSRDRKYTQE